MKAELEKNENPICCFFLSITGRDRRTGITENEKVEITTLYGLKSTQFYDLDYLTAFALVENPNTRCNDNCERFLQNVCTTYGVYLRF